MVGIYRIINKVNGKCYYGSSNNVEKRWVRHKNELNKRKHINIILQRAWDKYGSDNFIFELVESCDESLLIEIEQKYLDLKPEYNIGVKASGGDNLTNNPNRSEIISKMTKSIKDRYNSMTDDEKKEKYSKPKDKNPNWKGGKTFCKCGNRIDSKNKTCVVCVDRNGENNPFYKKKHSEETKKIISEARKGNYHGKQNNSIIIDEITYRSAGVASIILGIPMTTIRWRVKSDKPKFKNYKYFR
jgi:group I intron endonuclease